MLRIRSGAVFAGVRRRRGRKRRNFGSFSVGCAQDGGRRRVVRICRRHARSLSRTRAYHMARKLRALGISGRVPTVRGTVGRRGRRVLERGRTGRYRKPGGFVLRAYLRQVQGVCRVVYMCGGGFQPLSGQYETALRPFFRRRDQQHPADAVHLAARRRPASGRECRLRKRIQPQQHVVSPVEYFYRVPASLQFPCCNRG